MEYIGIIEGILYVVGDEGISFEQLLDILEIEESKLIEVLNILKKTYENEVRGFRLEFLGNKYKLTTKKEHSKYFEKLIENDRKDNLTEETFIQRSIQKATFIFDTHKTLKDKMKEHNVDDLYNNIELPLSVVLAKMELNGISVDKKILEDMKIEIKKEIPLCYL